MNKGTIRAFAAGIILSTAAIAGYERWIEPMDSRSMSIEQAKSLLQQKGYHVTTNPKQEKQKETANKKNPEPVEKEAKDIKPVQELDTEKKEAPQASSQQNKDQAAAYTLTIQSGMTTGEIAKLLVREGILRDASSFEKYMEQNELSKYIQIGDYVLTDNMTVQQVAKTITK